MPHPKAGDIVDCRFPEELGTPGPKERPALVLQVEEAVGIASGCVVVVAYATSQNLGRVYPGEFVIEASAGTGLTKPTKFDLTNRRRLPFDKVWFGSAVGVSPQHPCRGCLDLHDNKIKRTLQAAIMESKGSRRPAQ
jgi:mRNA-degrading endonuclease toxin of MazEF toxin-antitoxin module